MSTIVSGEHEGDEGRRRTSAGMPDCAREPVHVPGAIQPHGVLLALEVDSLRVLQVSANTLELLGIEPSALLGRALGELIDGSTLELPDAPTNAALETRNPVRVRVAGRELDAILHRSATRLLVELEPATRYAAGAPDLRHASDSVQRALVRLRTAETEEELFAIAASEVRAMTGFDRVMIYRFEPEGHGEVVAEAQRGGLDSFFGLHFPASDIPEPARRLYVLNPLRLIPDARYVAAPLVPSLDPRTGAPLDLTWSVLRSVAPVHLEYLANMGVRASMSISLLERDSLWGLVACHHATTHFVPYGTRLACELFAQVFAWQRALLADRERERARAHAGHIRMRIVRRMSGEGVSAGAMHGSPNVRDLVPSGGAALWSPGSCITLGATPSPARIGDIARWLQPGLSGGGVFHTDRLSRLTPLGAGIEDVASGLLAVGFSGTEDHVLFWFRPEVVQTVRWGGDVRAQEREGHLGPRRSFAEWVEHVRGSSLPWDPAEIEQAEELRAAILGIVVRTAAELARLNEELRGAVRSRDEFLSMASHELRTPLSTLELQLEVLLRLAESSPDTTLGADRVARSLGLARKQLTRLEQLVSEMLDLSRLSAGRLELEPTEGVDLRSIVDDVLLRFAERMAGIPVEVKSSGDSVGCWDASRLDQVVTNLLSNAIKYGDEKPVTIEIAGRADGVTLTVRDEGAGLSLDERAQLFSRFHRARSNQRRYAGFGLGLWIVKQFVEAHGGSVDVESEPGKGAAFRVALPRRSWACRIGPEGIS